MSRCILWASEALTLRARATIKATVVTLKQMLMPKARGKTLALSLG